MSLDREALSIKKGQSTWRPHIAGRGRRQLEVVMKTRAMSLAGLLLLSACGGDGPTEPTGPPPPNVAGTYVGYPMWTTLFNRTHDGYSGSFRCQGVITIVQAPGSSRFTGFADVSGFPSSYACPPISFSLTGTIEAGGAISIVTRGPRPPVGPCPTPGETTFTGVIEPKAGSGSATRDHFSARGTVKVDCPGAGEGEYSFDQIISAYQI